MGEILLRLSHFFYVERRYSFFRERLYEKRKIHHYRRPKVQNFGHTGTRMRKEVISGGTFRLSVSTGSSLVELLSTLGRGNVSTEGS